LGAVLVVAAWVAGGNRASGEAARAADVPTGPPLKAGQKYGFGVVVGEFVGKMLGEPRGGWVRVDAQLESKAVNLWLNLGQVTIVVPDPPADFGNQRFRGPGA
jgi:hypothetical protein